jgi:hypothetical protein
MLISLDCCISGDSIPPGQVEFPKASSCADISVWVQRRVDVCVALSEPQNRILGLAGGPS